MDKNNKRKTLVLSILGVLSLILITVGVTYAFFNYAKEGSTENMLTTGTITFLYTEVSDVGRGISLSDAYPISDSQGKAQTGEGNAFDFKVTSTTSTNSSIPYEITARKKDNSTLDESAVKLYLTKVSGDSEEEVLLDNYSNLTQTTKVSADKYIEKTLYTSKVPSNTANYEQAYRLRMWIDEDTDFSPVEDSDGNITYPYNDKEFTVTVNVYANAKIVTDEDIELEGNTGVSILVNGEELTSVTNQDYDYETVLSEGTTSTVIDVETVNPYAGVVVERIDSLAYSSNVKRLSTSKEVELTSGDNYFKITVTSENENVIDEYIINIISMPNCDEQVNTTWNFDYSGTTEKLRLFCSGNYQVETWGAQGGTATSVYHGGYGAYSKGIFSVSTPQSMYITVGGVGNAIEYSDELLLGGYNGGGTARTVVDGSIHCSGGGATHVATVSGLLYDLSEQKDQILIVSAGGGGAAYWDYLSGTTYYYGIGGDGGGIKGNVGTTTSQESAYPIQQLAQGGTQNEAGSGSISKFHTSSSYTYSPSGIFGAGSITNSYSFTSGGGSGFYGGGTGYFASGAGGSSYIGNSLLTDKIMYCYNCEESDEESTKTISTTNVSETPISNYAKIGNGYARITYMGN